MIKKKKGRKETRGDRDETTMIETPSVRWHGSAFHPFIGFDKVRPITLDKFPVPLVVSHHIIYRDYSPFITGLLPHNTMWLQYAMMPYTRI